MATIPWRHAAPVLVLVLTVAAAAQRKEIAWTEQEKPLAEQIRGLRQLPDDVRAVTTRQLALDIRKLPAGPNRMLLASSLGSLSTEGDFGRDTLEEVATTLATLLKEQPLPAEKGQPAGPYVTLAQLVRYEGVGRPLEDPQFKAAMKALEASDGKRDGADFQLTDLNGKKWRLRELKGKVVLVNFWATWCPPCRKEMPDLEKLHQEFQAKGLVVLAISDEEKDKVARFAAENLKVSFPLLIDEGRKVNEAFEVDGIPKTFIYNREGRLAAQSIDMRTRQQFLALLKKAGLE